MKRLIDMSEDERAEEYRRIGWYRYTARFTRELREAHAADIAAAIEPDATTGNLGPLSATSGGEP